MNSFMVGQAHACVMVQRIGHGKTYQIMPGEVHLLKADTIVMELENAKVIDLEGKEIHPTGKFLITAETIGPYHLVTDWF